MRSGGVSQKLTAILQHATAEKRAGDGTDEPHYNAIFGVHGNRPCYK